MFNKVILVGHVGKDPKVTFTKNGMICTTLYLATTEYFTNLAEEKDSRTEWFKVVAYKNTANIIDRYVKKGQMLFIEGKLHINSWTNKDGQQISIPEIIANKVLFTKNKTEDQSEALDEISYTMPFHTPNMEVDPVPF